MTEYHEIEEHDRKFSGCFRRWWWRLFLAALACVIVTWLFRW